MVSSGEINLCSHTYNLHYYSKNVRHGTDIIPDQPFERYITYIKKDYKTQKRLFYRFTSTFPTTLSYPHSNRSPESDKAILENTGYRILMAGNKMRGTVGNYFVDGCDAKTQDVVISRPCRMYNTPISDFIESVTKEQEKFGWLN